MGFKEIITITYYILYNLFRFIFVILRIRRPKRKMTKIICILPILFKSAIYIVTK